ncbi:hypothetical protein JL720_13985 [Aureococcus anophagefferens]|nr:hypothetical protein JL720_13985 [Aureococcus anophagefferens]
MRVAELLLAAQAARALVDVEWYCYEASNVVNASLADLSVAGGVNFTYYPVNHVNATSGAFECAVDGESLDCESTAYGGCMTDVHCRAGGCDAATQRKIARFLACFEGPYANREVNVNASRREPCFREAGLDFAPVRACYADAPRRAAIAARLNASKAAMMARLGASPGLFPHIFVDGNRSSTATWTALTRAICGALPARRRRSAIRWRRRGSSSPSPRGSCARARPSTPRPCSPVNSAASKAAFPVHFATDDDALPPGDPSYVDVRAATRASCAVADAAATCSYEVLGAFRGAVDQACRDGGFEAGLVYGLRHAAGLDADVAVRAC